MLVIIDEKYLICVNDAGEAVEHLLVMCGEFDRDWQVQADEVRKIVGTGEWLEEMEECERRVRWNCCWEKVWREKVTL